MTQNHLTSYVDAPKCRIWDIECLSSSILNLSISYSSPFSSICHSNLEWTLFTILPNNYVWYVRSNAFYLTLIKLVEVCISGSLDHVIFQVIFSLVESWALIGVTRSQLKEHKEQKNNRGLFGINMVWKTYFPYEKIQNSRILFSYIHASKIKIWLNIRN